MSHHHYVPERFLRQLWQHQQFEITRLVTRDGKSVEIFSPGVLNNDGGPDFREALIRIGGILYRGTVELHQYLNDWISHDHHRDPKYNAVILHVVLHDDTGAVTNLTKSNRSIPVLVLEQYLTQPYRETWNAMILNERAERLSTIKCCDVNEGIASSLITTWLEKLAVERLELKVRRFEERLKELTEETRRHFHEPPPRYEEISFGLNPEELPCPMPEFTQRDFKDAHLWEQLLYEGIIEALGFTKNQQPFLVLARNVTLEFLARERAVAATDNLVQRIEAILFAAAGLLPPLRPTMDKESKHHLTQLKRLWKEVRSSYRGTVVNEANWQFFRLRPENFPTIRIAGAARLVVQLLDKNFFRHIIQLMKNNTLETGGRCAELRSLFVIPSDGFWKNHFRFGEPAKTSIKTLIGESRADEIILNAVTPICLLYARIFKDKQVREGTLSFFRSLAPASSNTITTIMKKQLLKGKTGLDSAMLQQGVLQLYKFYCMEERCSECAVGKEVF